ncbi:DUF4389 domain-containing protein [Thiocapsa imhoffii]|nr:DUF4389 domain-containing protein [Thiocapsa imhoffii]
MSQPNRQGHHAEFGTPAEDAVQSRIAPRSFADPAITSAAEVPPVGVRSDPDPYSYRFADVPNPWTRIGRTLVRGVTMLGFVLWFEVLNYTIFAIALLQYLAILVSGRPIALLRRFNEGLSAYMGDLAGYLTCVDERAPFPFSRPRPARGVVHQPQWRQSRPSASPDRAHAHDRTP